jgi:hypothetical protein
MGGPRFSGRFGSESYDHEYQVWEHHQLDVSGLHTSPWERKKNLPVNNGRPTIFRTICLRELRPWILKSGPIPIKMWISNVQWWHEKQTSLFYNGYKMAAPREKASQNKGNKMAAPTQLQQRMSQIKRLRRIKSQLGKFRTNFLN